MLAGGSVNVRRRQRGCALWSDFMVVLGLCLNLCMQLPPGVSGHGYIIDPPSRSSEWRLGFNNPINYDDNGLNCGGFSRQWQQNGGRCGVCGDPWDVPQPRKNEIGGKYANGIIVRHYSAGQVVEMNVTITAQHWGWFEFRLCPDAESIDAPTTQECLDANLLEVKDSSSRTRYQLPSNATKGSFKVKVKLPEGIVCSHCVLHWKWHAGNSWGVGSDGVGCIGCGPQEEFINCADISISFNNSSDDRTASPSPKSTISLTPISSTVPSRSPRSSTTLSRLVSAQSATPETTRISPRTSPESPETTLRKLSSTTWLPATSTIPPASGCRAIGLFEGNVAMDKWCETNCALNFCPSTHCKCDQGGSEEDFTGCRSRGIWKSDTMDKWCISNCAGGNCPSDYCEC